MGAALGWLVLVGVVAALAVTVGVMIGATRYRRRSVAQLTEVFGPRGVRVPALLEDQVLLIGRMAAEAEGDRAAVRAGEERLRCVLGAIPSAVLVLDHGGNVRVANDEGDSLLSGRHGDVLVMDAVRSLLAMVGDAVDGHASAPVDLAGPPRRNLSIDVRRVTGPDWVVLVEDITERRRLEEVRRDFVANISHELKTPIGAIALLAETLSDEHDPEVLSRLAGRVHREALRVGSTIDGLLLLSRLEFAPPAAPQQILVASVIEEAIARVQTAADARRVSFGVEQAEQSLTVPGDRGQLVSAIYNLVDNAVKYSDDGAKVTVRAVMAVDALVIEVADTGIGIPARDLERVFERFYRVDRARSRVTGGTGLGLAIVRHVAHNHGGTVVAISREGVGSTFSLRLPASAASEAP